MCHFWTLIIQSQLLIVPDFKPTYLFYLILVIISLIFTHHWHLFANENKTVFHFSIYFLLSATISTFE